MAPPTTSQQTSVVVPQQPTTTMPTITLQDIVHAISSGVTWHAVDPSDVQLPRRGTSMSAGWDLFARPSEGDTVIPPRSSVMVRTGMNVAMEPGLAGFCMERSGNATKLKITLGARVIDADYRGELIVNLFNQSDQTVTIPNGNAVAQVVFVLVAGSGDAVFATHERWGEICAAEEHSNMRKEKGFGHTNRF